MKPSKTPSKLSDSIHQQLNMYALAAGAAGVGLMALAKPAEGKIVYTPANVVIGHDMQFYYLDLNHDHTVDFTLQYFRTSSTGGFSVNRAIYLSPASGNGELAYLGGKDKPKPRLLDYALKPGDSIGPKRRFSPEKGGLVELHMNRRSGYNKYGVWNDAGNRYLGLKFKINGETHYGWARLNVWWGGNGIEARLTGYAYETIPNKAIIAGATKGADDSDVEQPDAARTNPVPDTRQPGTLGALAMGAPGLSIWRREDSVVALERN